MNRKRIYIFNKTSGAAEYGVGTYINQLVTALKSSDLEFNLIHLYARGQEVNVEEKEGYKQINIPAPFLQFKNGNRYFTRNITCLLKEFIPEEKGVELIFHLNFMSDEYLVDCLKKRFRCKVILVAHYTDWSFALFGDYSRLKKLMEKSPKELKKTGENGIVSSFRNDIRMIHKVDYLVCVAQHTYKEFHLFSPVPSEKTEVINNALQDIYRPVTEEEKVNLRKKYHLAENTKIVVFAGRLVEVKGLAGLIRAFKRLLVIHPDTHLFILGDGDFTFWMKEAADFWAKITFTGRLEKKKLYEFYTLADMGVACSLHEEFGFVAIEMMMHALPVIVTKTGGLDEIVEDNISGLKIPVQTRKGKRQISVKSLSDKMEYLLTHPVEAKTLGENGRKRFLEKYELSLFKEKMLKLYQNI
jgi:glycosyltransferase